MKERTTEEWLESLTEPDEWQVIEVIEGRMLWYEVRAKDSTLVVTHGLGGPHKFITKKGAQRLANKLNVQEQERANRRERVVG